MTAPALPEDVERAIKAAVYDLVADGYDAAPDNKHYCGPRGDAVSNAADAASDNDSICALRAAIARALPPPVAEPVAYGAGSRVVVIGKAMNDGHNFVGRTGVVVEPIDHKTARWVRFDGDDNKTSVPMRCLAQHPTAPVAPTVEAALAALDVENDYAPDRGTTYQIVGLDDVRAAHRAEVDALSARVAKLEAALRNTASMLAYEATCHEESGDAKRRSYVAPIRAQVDAARAALGDKS